MPRRESIHAQRGAQRRRSRRPEARACSARSAESTGQRCPVPWPLGAHGLPVRDAVAVAVAVVPVPARARSASSTRSSRRRPAATGRCRVGGRQFAEPHELEEARVDHRPLVERRTAVADVVRDRGVRIARLRETDEVARRERSGRRHRPALDLALPVVGDAEPERSDGCVAVRACEVGGGDEAGDLGRDRRGRVAALLFPALDAERRPVRDEEVRSRPDVVGVEGGVGEPELVGHEDRVGRLVELRPERVRCSLAVDEAVARHRPVRELLPLRRGRVWRRAQSRDRRRRAGPSRPRRGRGRRPRGRSRSTCSPDPLPRSPDPTARRGSRRCAPGNVLSSDALSTFALR